MKVSLSSPLRKRQLDSTGEDALLDSLHSMIEIIPSGNETFSLMMGDEVFPVRGGSFKVPVLLSNDYTCRFSVSTQTETVGYTLRFPDGERIETEQLINLMQLTDSLRILNELNNFKGITVGNIMDAQQQGDLSLLCVIKPLTGYDNSDLQDKLQQDLSQKVRAICSRPKRGTRTEEIVQDVGLVKKTSTNTLVHLASHTEHWKARKLSSLIPKRLLSVVIEDELNIYENLFFKAAIDEIADYVAQQIRRLKNASRQKKNADITDKYANQMGDWKRAQILKELLPGNKDSSFFDLETSRKYQDFTAVWKSVDALLRNIRNSSFYRQINSKQRIGHEIYQTNIIRNDQRYHALYDLLIAVRRDKEQEQKIHKGDSDRITGNPNHFYANYIIVLVLWCMARKLGISFSEESVLRLSDKDRLTGRLIAEDNVISYQLNVEYDEFDRASVRIDMQEKGDQSFPVPRDCPVTADALSQFDDLLSLRENIISFSRKPNMDEQSRLRKLFQKKTNNNKPQINQAWIRFVDGILSSGKIRDLHKTSVVIRPLFWSPSANDHLLPNLMRASDQTDDTLWVVANSMDDTAVDDNQIRFMINYGDMPVAKGNKPYHHGVLPAMQVDSLSSQRVMKYLTIRRALAVMSWEEDNPTHCPVCLSDNIRKTGEHTWQCLDDYCGSKWGKTHCVAENGCGEYFDWVWPDEENMKSLREDDVNESSELNRVQRRDVVFGANIVTDFEYNPNSVGEIRPYPVCPYCGKRRFTAV